MATTQQSSDRLRRLAEFITTPECLVVHSKTFDFASYRTPTTACPIGFIPECFCDQPGMKDDPDYQTIVAQLMLLGGQRYEPDWGQLGGCARALLLPPVGAHAAYDLLFCPTEELFTSFRFADDAEGWVKAYRHMDALTPYWHKPVWPDATPEQVAGNMTRYATHLELSTGAPNHES